MKQWLSEHPTIISILIVAGCAVLIVAILAGRDLSWLPAMLRGLLGQ